MAGDSEEQVYSRELLKSKKCEDAGRGCQIVPYSKLITIGHYILMTDVSLYDVVFLQIKIQPWLAKKMTYWVMAINCC